MTLSEKSIGATFGAVLVISSAYMFLYFSSMAAIDESYKFWNWLSALLSLPGLYILFYCTMSPIKDAKSASKEA